MKNKRRLNFYIDCKTADNFKIGCIKNQIKMSEFLVEAIKIAIETGIYYDLTKKKD